MPMRFGEEISSGAACNPAGMTVRNGGTIGGEFLPALEHLRNTATPSSEAIGGMAMVWRLSEKSCFKVFCRNGARPV